MASIPSLKTLTERLGPFVVKEHGEAKAKVMLLDLYLLLSTWKKQRGAVYKRDVTSRMVLEAANRMLDAHGIEYLRPEDDGMYDESGAYYVNMGDTYDTTLLLDTRKDRFLVTSWGDFVESEERQGRRFV